jgi:hypothetical protein
LNSAAIILEFEGKRENRVVKEKIFNLFLFVENDIIVNLGARCHQADGSDREKLSFLQRHVKHDLPEAVRFPIPNRYHLILPDGSTGTGLQYLSYQKLTFLRRHLDVFEEVFAHFGASDNPLMCITPIVDDKVRVDSVSQG